jgi:hypothetical protein
MKDDPIAAIRHTGKLLAAAFDAGHMITMEARLHAEGASGSSLTFKTMANGNPHRLSRACEPQLTAIACGLSNDHGFRRR